MSGSFEALERQAEPPATAPTQLGPAVAPVAQLSRRAGNQAVALAAEAKQAADAILDRLRGYTSDADSHAILQQFEGRRPAAVRAIMTELRARAAGAGETPEGMLPWLLGDMTVPDRERLRTALANAQEDVCMPSEPPGDASVAAVGPAAEAILRDLEGITTAAASHRVLAAFTERSPAAIAAILAELKARAAAHARDPAGVTEWLLGELTEADRRELRNLLIRVGPKDDVARMAAADIKDRLDGYTSEDDSRAIAGTVAEFADSGLDALLTELEAQTGKGEAAVASQLFRDLDGASARDLEATLFKSAGGKALRYATLASAAAMIDLLAGFTSHADARSVVERFGRVPNEYQRLVLAELDSAARAKWGKPAEQVLQENLSRDSYEEIRGPLGLKPYPGDTRGKLRRFLDGAVEVVGDVIEVAVGAVAGVITGIGSFLWGFAGIVIDIPVAAYHLVMSLVHLVSFGALGSREWLETKEFFAGLGQLLSHPVDMLSEAWDRTRQESAAIEGPFEYGRRTEFWVQRAVSFILNLFFVVKGAAKAVRGGAALAEEARRIGVRAAFVKTGGRAAAAGGELASKLGKAGARLLGALKRPVDTLGAIGRRLNVIRAAARDQEVWSFLRGRATGLAQDEAQWWREWRESWRPRGAASEAQAAALDARAAELEARVGGGEAGEGAEAKLAELEDRTGALDKDVAGQEEEAFGTRQPQPQSPAPEASPAPETTQPPAVTEPTAQQPDRPQRRIVVRATMPTEAAKPVAKGAPKKRAKKRPSGPRTGADWEREAAKIQKRHGHGSVREFALGDLVEKRSNFKTIAQELEAARQRVIAAGLPDPFPNGLHTDVLTEETIAFILEDDELKQEWQRLSLAVAGLGRDRAYLRASAEYRALPEAYRNIDPQGKIALALRTDFQDFFSGQVGNRKPDIVDFWLDWRRLPVVTDTTLKLHDLFHNFKTQFYAKVLEHVMGVPVEAVELSPTGVKIIR